MKPTIKIKADRKKLFDQFRDHNTKITSDHLTESCRDDLIYFKTALWGAWLMEAYDRLDGVGEKELNNLTIQFFNLQAKIEKALEFADLVQYATGFEIPEDETFRYINVKALAEDTND